MISLPYKASLTVGLTLWGVALFQACNLELAEPKPMVTMEPLPPYESVVFGASLESPVEDPEEILIDHGKVRITAYCSCAKCCGIWSESHPSRLGTDYVQRTSSGTIPKANHTIAADPSVFPYGTQLVIDGITYTVEDTGGAMKGKSLDIYFDSHELAVNHGVQYKQLFELKGE